MVCHLQVLYLSTKCAAVGNVGYPSACALYQTNGLCTSAHSPRTGLSQAVLRCAHQPAHISILSAELRKSDRPLLKRPGAGKH